MPLEVLTCSPCSRSCQVLMSNIVRVSLKSKDIQIDASIRILTPQLKIKKKSPNRQTNNPVIPRYHNGGILTPSICQLLAHLT
jgi:hypothetical protein